MKRLALFVIFLMSISMVSAEFNRDSAVGWLKGEVDNKWSSLGNDMEKISFSVLALNLNGEDETASAGLGYLNGKEDQNNCYPDGNCNTKDTALAALTLSEMGGNIAELLDYLGGNLQSTGVGSDGLIIQIITNEEGICEFEFDEGSIYETSVNSENPWIYLSSIGVNFDNYAETINVNCDFASSPRISLIRESNNNIYIINEKGLTNSAEFIVESGCYSVNSGSNACDADSTFYASWVLYKLNSDIFTENYMNDNVGNNELRSAMLSLIDNSKAGNLINMQLNDGSFGSIYETAFAIDSLKNSEYSEEKEDAILYIESQQSDEGNIGILKDTAASLYLIYSSGSSANDDDYFGYCGDATVDSGEECEFDTDCQSGYSCSLQCICEPDEPSSGAGISECGNNVCENDESSSTCPLDCTAAEESCGNFVCEPEKGEDSFVCTDDCYCGDFVCDESEEANGNCPQDCQAPETGGSEEPSCGDGFCDFDEDSNICPEDCDEGERASLWWLWLVIIILIMGGGIFVYVKMKKGNSHRSESSSPGMPPTTPGTQRPIFRKFLKKSPKDERLENQLDESIRKAKELLKK